MKLSIIVPTYNVEKYLDKCLSSCISQDIPSTEYEIIVINDGSKDNSAIIAGKYVTSYSNVYLFSQENRGLSAARNAGLKKAQGEYVWFIDSDDSIQDNCLMDLLSYCTDIDVLCLSYVMQFEDGKDSRTTIPPTPKELKGKFLLYTNSFCVPAQFYIYKREFLLSSNLSFFEGIYHEDMDFTPRMLFLADNIALYPAPIYYYHIRANSITTTVNSKKSFDLIKVAKNLHVFSNEHINDEESKLSFSFYISMCINNALSLSRYYNKKEKFELNHVLNSNRILFSHLKQSPSIKNRMEGYLFSLLPSHTLRVYGFLSFLNSL